VKGEWQMKLKMNKEQMTGDTKEVIQEFINDCKSRGLSKATINVYEININYLIDYLDSQKMDLKNVSTKVIQDYKSYLVNNTNRNNTSINTTLRHIKVFLDWTYENGYTDLITIKYLKVQQKAKEIYTDEQIKILLRKPNMNECSYADFRTWAIINLFVSTGIRRSSLLNIKLEDINWKDNIIKLNHTKNKQVHYVSMSTQLSKVIKEWLKYRVDGSDYLFTGQTGKQLSPLTVSSSVLQYNRSRDVDITSVHAFRHYYAQKLVSTGIDIYTISKLLGHSNIQITQNYLKSLNVEDFVKNNSVNVYDLLE
jgi:integrase/recombinase XerD